jgi:hypothetical protein
MNAPSAEQQSVIDNLKKGNNVICSAVAGSGKSSTVLSTAIQMPHKNILQITYNSSLRLEIKEKVRHLNLNNITIHTFHSLAVKYYSPDCHTDTGIRYILFNNTPPHREIEPIDLCMLDEFQDCSELYYKFVVKFLRDTGSQTQLLILGDPLQCLYEFKGADARFLTMSAQIWADCPLLKSNEFVHCPLQMSYRITNQMCDFVNKAMMGRNLLLACRDGDPVNYIRNSRSNLEKIVVATVRDLLESGVSPSEIFILAASVKGVGGNVRKMENALVAQNIPCHVPMSETEKMDDRVIDGKIVFSTFHCSKGRQRKYVFIVGFDNNYFNQFARRITDKTQCPNTLYVGCTRATHGLYLMEGDQYPTDRPLEFLKMGHHDFVKSNFVRFRGTPRSIFYTDGCDDRSKSLIDKKYESPTSMIKFIPETTLDFIQPLIDKICFSNSPQLCATINVPSVIQTKRGFYETVSDLNGIAIPAMFCGGTGLRDTIDAAMLEMKEHEHQYLREIINDLPDECREISDYLFLANIQVAINERLYFKLRQIGRDEYNWLTSDMISQCLVRMETIIGCDKTKMTTEQTIIQSTNDDAHSKIDQTLAPYFPENMRFRMTAIVDLYSDITVWELKCTTMITIEHKLQLIIYAWIWEMLDKPKKNIQLLNILTGEQFVLIYTVDELTEIVVALLKGKYEEQIVISDTDFIDVMKSVNRC